MDTSDKDGKRFPDRFFRVLFKTALKKWNLELEVRCIHADGSKPVVRRFFRSVSKLKKQWPELLRLNRKKYNIYFGVVPRNPAADHKLGDPVHLAFLWADVDVGADKASKSFDEAIQRIRKWEVEPTGVVKSGHGAHVYYLLRKATKVKASRVKKWLRALAEKIGGDNQSAEVARLLRMPNTLNWKDKKKPVLCEVFFLKSKKRYRLAELKKHLAVGIAQEKEQERQDTNPEDYFSFFEKHVNDLRMRGANQAMGLCPFHDDTNPSFSLRVIDGVWYCFGCGRAGNAISFCHMRSVSLSECPGASESQEYKAVAVEGGGYVAWKWERSKWRKKKLCNFRIEWNLEKRVSDRIRLEDRLFEGTLVIESGETIPIRVTNAELCSNASFYEALIREGGSKISLNEYYVSHIRRASLLFSKARMLTTSMDFGFQDDQTFLTPTLNITAQGIETAKDSLVDLSAVEHACHLDLKKVDKEQLRVVLENIRDNLLELHPHRVTYTLLGFLGAAPLMYFMEDTTRYALWLVGQSGTGKSFVAKLFQCFSGDFTAEGRPVSWASTPNSLQYMGYFFKDCVYLVDDYKPVMIRSSAEVVRLLQNYADFYARSRLTSEIKSRKDYYVRGALLTTGEDMPAGHASLVARSLIVNVRKRRLDTARGGQCLALCKDYPGVTASYIQFLLCRPDLRKQVNTLIRRYHDRFLKGIAREDNSVRIARNLALNRVGFFYFTRFLKAAKVPFHVNKMRREHFRGLVTLRDQMLDLIKKENPGEIFLQVLTEAIGSGRARILTRPSLDPGQPIVGFDADVEDGLSAILPREAMALVREQERRAGREFDWTPNAVTKQLIALEALVKRQSRQDAGTTVRFAGKIHRVWMIRDSFLGLAEPLEDECDVT